MQHTPAPPEPAVALDEKAAELAALMARYCAGEARAFHQIYEALAPRILAYTMGLVGDRASAEDLLQQTFLKLHQGRATYVKGANPVPWLYTIAHRTCIDELRRRKRARVRLSLDGVLPVEPAVDLHGSPEPAVDPGEDAALAQGLAALATLPAPLRQAVMLTKIQGHSTAQAAVIAGTTVGAIKVRAHRGYVALRAKLTKVAPPGRGLLGGVRVARVALDDRP